MMSGRSSIPPAPPPKPSINKEDSRFDVPSATVGVGPKRVGSPVGLATQSTVAAISTSHPNPDADSPENQQWQNYQYQVHRQYHDQPLFQSPGSDQTRERWQELQEQADLRSQATGLSDPGDNWLPLFLKDKTKQELQDVLQASSLLSALTNSPSTIHPSLGRYYQVISAALHDNIHTASQLLDLDAQLAHQRESIQGQLLSAHALERQWQQRQRDVDIALNPFSPSALYQKLCQGLQDQDGVCRSLEDSFLEGGFAGQGEDRGIASEREVVEWTRRYRDQKRLYYLRKERKARWDDGRVGGWR